MLESAQLKKLYQIPTNFLTLVLWHFFLKWSEQISLDAPKLIDGDSFQPALMLCQPIGVQLEIDVDVSFLIRYLHLCGFSVN